MRVGAALIAVAAIAIAGCGGDASGDGKRAAGGDDIGGTTGPIEIVEIVDDVEYYIACANRPVEIAGTRWYPVTEWGNDELADLHAEIVAVDRDQPVRPTGFAPRVAPPGPGDDIGTLYVYADDVAYYESDSGQSTWLTSDELTYDWVC